MKKYWTSIKYIIFIVVFILSSLFLFTILPTRTLIKTFVVLSGSMRPTIKEGSIIFVKRGISNFNKGDIITFINPINPKENLTHRIYSVEKIRGKFIYRTKGDSNVKSDNFAIKKEAIWGKVIFSLPFLGYPVDFVKTKHGSILLIVLPVLIIVVDEIRIIHKEIKKLKRKKRKTKTKPNETNNKD